jgi:hypothetical protein
MWPVLPGDYATHDRLRPLAAAAFRIRIDG